MQICRKNVKTEESKSGAKMVNATFTKKQGVFIVFFHFPQIYSSAFTILRHIILQEANLYKYIFSSSERVCSLDFETEKEVIMS